MPTRTNGKTGSGKNSRSGEIGQKQVKTFGQTFKKSLNRAGAGGVKALLFFPRCDKMFRNFNIYGTFVRFKENFYEIHVQKG